MVLGGCDAGDILDRVTLDNPMSSRRPDVETCYECFCGLPVVWRDGWVHSSSGDVRCFPDEPVDDRAAPVVMK